jgi:2'-5' RNA ligase
MAELKRLYDRLEQGLFELGGYRKEERGYTPHLTLGRVKSESDTHVLVKELPRYQAWDVGRTVVEEVLVFASELEKEGPRHTVLGRGELSGK